MSLKPTTELLADRATAGAAYAAAVNAFWSSWVELFAIDLALDMSGKRRGQWPDAGTMTHTDFLPTHTAENGNWSAAAQARAGAIIADGYITAP